MSNLFESVGKTTQNIVESVDDASQLFLNSIWNHTPGALAVRDPLAKPHSDAIRSQIDLSLLHGDVNEAAEQMRRELYFCSTIDGLAGTKNELAARAGLDAIEKGLPPLAVSIEMEHATDDPYRKGLFSKEPDLIDWKLKLYQDDYQNNPARFCHRRVNLHNEITEATEKSEPVNPKDRVKLAMYDLAFSDFKVKSGDGEGVVKFVSEAREMLKAAKAQGEDTNLMERILLRVSSKFLPGQIK
jgi:hypothetical protein